MTATITLHSATSDCKIKTVSGATIPEALAKAVDIAPQLCCALGTDITFKDVLGHFRGTVKRPSSFGGVINLAEVRLEKGDDVEPDFYGVK